MDDESPSSDESPKSEGRDTPDAEPGPRTTRLPRYRRRDARGAARRPAGAGEPASRDDTPPFGRRRHGRFAVGTVAVLVVAALVAALLVLAGRGWLGQRRAQGETEEQLDQLWWVNKRNVNLKQDVLDAAVARALAKEGVEREVAPRKL